MSDLHRLPLRGHDMPSVRAKVFTTSPRHWYWRYQGNHEYRHGPFGSQAEAFGSAWHAVEVL